MIKIISPPMSSPEFPLLGAQVITDLLENNKIKIDFKDLNLEFYQYILEYQNVMKLIKKAEAKILSINFDENVKNIKTLQSIRILKKDFCQKKTFKKHSLYKYHSFYILQHIFNIISFIYYPLILNVDRCYFSNLPITEYNKNLTYLEERIKEKSIFTDFLDLRKEWLLKEEKSIFGISVTFVSQLIPTIFLAKYIKSINNKTKLFIGGRLICELGFNSDFFLYEDFDFVSQDINAKDLLKWMKHSGILKEIKTDKITLLPTLNKINIDEYFSINSVIPLKVCQGCYWSRCNFCSIHYPYNSLKYIEEPYIVVSYIKQIKKLQKTSHFIFFDEALPVNWLTEFCSLIIKENLKIYWAINGMRCEDLMDNLFFHTLKKAGCISISFGMETANQALRNTMNKGVSNKNITKCIDFCDANKILMIMSLFAGYPGESEKTLEETYWFIKKNQKKIRYLAHGTFELTKRSPLGEKKLNEKKQSIQDYFLYLKKRESRQKTKLYNSFSNKLDELYPFSEMGSFQLMQILDRKSVV